MKIIYVTVTLFVVAGITKGARDDCHMEKFQNCVFLLKKFAAENTLPFPATEEELNDQCEILDTYRGCSYNYSQKCLSGIGKSIGDLLASNTNENIKSFCTEGGKLHKDFLANMKCIGDNYDGVSPCIKQALAVLEILPTIPAKKRLLTLCCAYNQVQKCVGKHYETKCNQDVASLAGIIIEFAVTDVTTLVCESIELSEKCPELPPIGTPLTGDYKKSIIGDILESFVRN